MSDDRDLGADEPERPTLREWGASWTAPPALRAATLRAAHERGLVKETNMGKVWVIAAAAAAVTFVLGLGLGSRGAQSAAEKAGAGTDAPTAGETATPAAEAAGDRYALFLFEDERYQTPSETELRGRIGEYTSWARGVSETGRYVTGEKLADDGRFCRLEGGQLSSSGPQSDAKRGVLAGYFVIGAPSLEEAMQVASTCPHLKYGGTVEIRKLET